MGIKAAALDQCGSRLLFSAIPGGSHFAPDEVGTSLGSLRHDGYIELGYGSKPIVSIIRALAVSGRATALLCYVCGYRIVFKGKNNKKIERVRTARFSNLAPLPGLEPRSNP